jgi:hypothetical protein
MPAQIDLLDGAERDQPPQDFGEKGRRAWFWQNRSWQVGTAFEIKENGRVAGMCRDYGPWGMPYPGSMPLQTHGSWPQREVRFKRPANQYEGPCQ